MTHLDVDSQRRSDDTAARFAALRQACNAVFESQSSLNISDETNLFDAGLDSIHAIRLAFLLKTKGWSISSSQILVSTGKASDIIAMLKPISPEVTQITVAGLPVGRQAAVDPQVTDQAETVEPDSLRGPGSSIHREEEESGTASPHGKFVPVSPSQLALIAATLRHTDETQEANPPYSARYTISLSFAPDPLRVRQACEGLVKAHAALRTGFLSSRSGIVQVIRDHDAKPLVNFDVVSFDKDIDVRRLPPLGSLLSLDANPPIRIHLDCANRLLVLDLHHAIFDGWSLSLMLDDLDTRLRNPAVSNQPPDHRVGPNIVPSNGHLASDAGSEFWTSLLGQVEPCSWPPFRRNDGSVPISSHHMNAAWNCSAFTSTFRNKFSATPSSVVRTALAMVLHMHSTSASSSTVTFSAVSSGRAGQMARQAGDLVGCYVVTLPVVAHVGSDLTIQQLVSDIGQQQADSLEYEHDYIPNRTELAKLSPQCLLTFQNFPKGRRPDNQLQIISQQMVRDYCLCVDALPRQDDSGIDFELHYDLDIISEQEAKVFLDHLCLVMTQLVCSRASEPVEAVLGNVAAADADLVLKYSTRGKETVSGGFPGEYGCTVQGDNILQMVSSAVQRLPHKIALSFEESDFLSYSEFDRITSRSAQALVQHGVLPGECVFVSMDRSIEQILAIYAILKAGATFSPLDPAFPRQRKELLIGLASAKLVLTDRRTQHPDQDPANVEVLDFGQLLQRTGERDIDDDVLEARSPAQDDVAYLLFTSGTTGTPKPVEIQHKALASFVRATAAYGQLETSRRLAVAAFTFDVSVHDWAGALAYGTTLCVASTDTLLGDITSTLNALRITMAQMTPTVANFIRCNEVDHLDILILSGESVSKTCRDNLSSRFRLINSFGPTETTVDVCSHDFGRGDNAVQTNSRIVPIGIPLGDSQLYIVDLKTLEPRPLLCPGEIIIGGPQLARGYRGLDEQTRKSFVELALPSLDGPGSSLRRFYRTGDLGRLHPDGLLEHLGRIDSQVKIKGRRIELEEIENVIADALSETSAHTDASPSAPRTCVDAIDSSMGSKTLAAWISSSVIRSSALNASKDEMLRLVIAGSDKTAQLLATLRSRLPSYMVPSEIFFLQALPITPSGKTDRRALTSATDELRRQARACREAPSQPRLSKPAVPARTREASLLCQAFTHVLGLPMPCETTDFTAVGGDSITAIKVIAHLRVLLAPQETLPLLHSHLFRFKTISALADFWRLHAASSTSCDDSASRQLHHDDDAESLSSSSDAKPWTDAAAHLGIDADQIEDAFPVTQLQEALLASTLKDRSAYLAEFRWRLGGSVDAQCLLEAWHMLVSKQPILRSVFVPCDGGLYQLVLSHALYASLDFLGFDWGRPMHRATIDDADQSGGRHFVLHIHHALYDGWSLALLLADLTELYQNIQGKQSAQMDPRPGFSIVARHEATSQVIIKSDISFWRSHLERHIVPSWPAPPSASFCAERGQLVSTPVTNLKRGLAEMGLTLGSAVASALSMVLSKYTDTHDILFDLVTSGRTGFRSHVADIASIVGPCVATLPFRLQSDASSSLADIARSALNEMHLLDTHNSVGLAQISKALNGEIRPLSTILLTMSSETEVASSPHATIFPEAPSSRMRRNYAICLDVGARQDTVDFNVFSDKTVIMPEDAKHLCLHVGHALQHLVHQGSHSRLSDFKLFGPADLRVLQEAETSYMARRQELSPSTLLLAHEYLDKHAATCPTKIAIQYKDRFWTYGQVRERASRRARTIRRRLTQAKHSARQALPLVPILASKDDEFVVNCFAVMMAGGGYVPVDPQWPLRRQLHVVEAVSASFVLLGAASNDADAVSRLAEFKSIAQEKGINLMTVEELENAEDVSNSGQKHAQGDPLIPDLAYVLFTSGTSGKPKGVQVTASNLAAFLQGALAMYPEQNCWSRRGSFASQTFDVSCHDIFGAIAAGSCLCLAPSMEMRLDLQHTLSELRISLIQLTPSVAKIIDIGYLPCLQALITSGEALPSNLVDAITRHVPLFNSNGPTEATVDYSTRLYEKTTAQEGPLNLPWVSVGKPIGLSRYFVVDSDQRPCAIGQSGEVVVSGPQVARGYLNMPDQTSKSFIQAQYLTRALQPVHGDGDAERVVGADSAYFTGDVGVLHANGELQLIGRRDGQVKINGLRIELEEIAAVIERCHYVSAAAALVGSDERIVSFVARAKPDQAQARAVPDQDAVIGQVLAEARSSLPTYMVPSRIVVLENSLPITPSGKIDRARLLAMDLSPIEPNRTKSLKTREMSTSNEQAAESTPSTSGLNKSQLRVRRVWAEVLGIPESSIGTHTPWQAAGGDSIQLIRLYSAARRHGLQLPVTAQITIAAQALGVKSLNSDSASSDSSCRDRRSVSLPHTSEEVVPLSAMQRHFFSKTGALDRYAQSTLLRFNGAKKYSIGRINACLSILMQRHAQLRCTFSRADPHDLQPLLQTCLPFTNAAPVWPVRQAGDCATSEEVNEAIDGALSSLRVSGQEARLLCGCAFSFQGGRYLLLAVHHLVIDLISWDILLDDLEALLGQEDQPCLKALSPSGEEHSQPFGSFVAALEEEASTVPLFRMPSFTKVLPALQESDTPATAQTYTSFSVTLAPIESKQGASSQSSGLGSVDQVLAMVAEALFGLTGVQDPIIAFESHGRDALHNAQTIAETVGWFTLVAPLRLQRGRSVEETLQLARAARLADMDAVQAAAELAAPAPASCSKPRWPLLLNLHAQSSSPSPDSPDNVFQASKRSFEPVSAATRQQLGLDWVEMDPNATKDAEVAIDIEQEADGSLTLNICHRDHCSSDRETMDAFVDAIQSAHSRVGLALKRLHQNPPCLSRADLLPHLRFSAQDWDRFVSATCAAANLRLHDVDDLLPATPMQEALVLETQRIQGSYITTRTFKVDLETRGEPSSLSRIKRAMDQLSALHPTLLRSRFIVDSKKGLLLAVLRPTFVQPMLFALCEDAIKGLGVAPEALGDPFAQPFGVKVHFDPNSGAMLLTMVMHHSLVDAWSLQLLLQDFEILLRDSEWRPPSERIPFPTYLKDFAARDRTTTRKYWTRLLDSVLPLASVPFADRLARTDSSRAASMQLVKKVILRSSICSKRNSLSTGFILSWAAVLSANSRCAQAAVLLGLVHSGRDVNVPGIVDLVGPTVTTLPVPVLFRPDWSPVTLLTQLDRTLSLANQHCDIGLNELVSCTQLRPRDMCSFVTFRNLSGDDGTSRPDSLLTEISADDHVQIPLSISAGPGGDGEVWIELLHDSNVFSCSEAEKLLEDTVRTWQMLLQVCEGDCPDRSLSLPSPLGNPDTVGTELPGVVASAQPTLPIVHQKLGGCNVPEPPSVSKPKNIGDNVKKLQGIWTRVFDIQSGTCPIDVPFTELGGSSLMAMRLMAEMREAGFQFRVADLLKPSSIEDLLGLNAGQAEKQVLDHSERDPMVSSERGSTVSAERSPTVSQATIVPQAHRQQPQPSLTLPEDIDLPIHLHDHVDSWYICPPTQEALMAVGYATSQDEALENQAYVARLCFQARADPLDPQRLEAAFKLLTDRHEILRTAFVHSSTSGFVGICYRVGSEALPKLQFDRSNSTGESHQPSAAGQVPWRAVAVYDGKRGGIKSVEWEMHHALYDGVTISILMDELSIIYRQWSASSLPPAVAYSSFAASTRDEAKHLQQTSSRYWAHRLSGCQALNWPCDGGSKLVAAAKTNAEAVIASDRVDIEAMASALQVLPGALVRLVCSLLVSKLSGCEEVTFDWVSSGRARPGLREAAGPTILTYPTRIHVPPASEAIEDGSKAHVWRLLDAIQDDLVDESRHSWMGKRGILRSLGPTGSSLMNQILVTYQPPSSQSRSQIQNILVPHGASMSLDYALSVEIVPVSAGQIEVMAAFDDSLISSADARMFVEQLVGLFEHLAPSDASARRSTCIQPPIRALLDTGMAPEELRIVRALHGAPSISINRLPSVHELVLNQQRLTPDKIALQYGGEFVTYKELVQRATHLSHSLRDLCPGAQRVGICVKRGVPMVVAMLGVLLSSAAYVPIDPDLPSARCVQVAQAADIHAVIASDSTRRVVQAAVDKLAVQMLSSEELESRVVPPEAAELGSSVSSQSLAYIIPTSGSTGTPKACAVTHVNATAFLTEATAYYRLSSFDKKLQAANFAFDVSVFDIWGTLSVGGCVVGAPKEDMFGDMTAVIQQASCTFLDLTPTVASLLSAVELPTVHSILLGGEPLSRPLLHTWLQAGTTVFNASSPTECVVNVLAHRFDTSNKSASLPYIPIGRPLGHSRIYLLNERMHHVRVGEVGEIFIGGPQVGAGYFGDAAKTKAVFLENVEISIAEQRICEPRLFRSGDMGRLHGDGLVEHLGRRDGQTKLNGLRIELGDVETCLVSHPLVRRACVVKAVSTSSRQERLLAFVELHSPECGSEAGQLQDELIRSVKHGLPAYMIPEQVLVVPSLPLTPSGKIDRRNLQERAQDASIADVKAMRAHKTILDSPVDEFERALITLCCEVLHVQREEVSMEAPWSHLGGDSISSIRMISRCRREHGVKLGFGTISRSTTLREIGDTIREQRSRQLDEKSQDVQSRQASSRSRIDRAVPLSPLQARFWTLFQNHTELDCFSQSQMVPLPKRGGDLWSAEQLQKVLQKVQRNHQALVSSFTKDAVTPLDDTMIANKLVKVHRRAPVSLTDAEEACRETIGRLSLQRGRLLAATLLRYEGEEALFIAAHHFVVDIVSWKILLDDVALLLKDVNAPLPDPTDSYLLWAEETREQQQPNQQAVPFLPKPLWATSDCQASFVSHRLLTDVDCHAVCSRLAIEPLEMMLGAVAIALNEACEVPETGFTLAVEGHGRKPWNMHQDLTRSVGWYSAFYPVDGRLDDACDLRKSLRQTRDDLLLARKHHLPSCLPVGEHRWPVVLNFHGSNSLASGAHSSALSTLKWEDGGYGVVRDAVVNIEVSASNQKIHWLFEGPSDLKAELETVSSRLASVLDRMTAMTSVHLDCPPLGLSMEDLDSATGLEKEEYRAFVEADLPRLGFEPWQIERVSPCTALQEALVAAGDESDRYRGVRWYDVANRNLPSRQLKNVWKSVVSATEILRSTFVHHEKRGLLRLSTASSWKEPLFLSSTASAEIDDWIRQQGHPALSPVAAAVLENQDGLALRFVTVVHHALSDAWTMDLIDSDLERILTGTVTQEHTSPLLRLPASPSFESVVHHYQNKDRDASKVFWKDQISGLTAVDWPRMGSNNVEIPTRHLRARCQTVPTFELTHFAAEARRRHGISPADVFQLAWAMLLHRRAWQGADSCDVAFGLVLAGRDIPVQRIEKIRGPCLQIAVARYRFEADEGIVETIKSLQTQQDHWAKHAYVGIGEMLSASGRSSIHHLFHTLASFRSLPGDVLDEGTQRTLVLTESDDRISVPISISASPDSTGDKIEFDLLFDEQSLDPHAADLLVQELRHTFEALYHGIRAGRAISTIGAVEAGQAELMQGISRPSPSEQGPSDLVSLFLRQVERTPQKVFCQQDEALVTYREMERLTRRGALVIRRCLKDGNAEASQLIPVRFVKSMPLLVAILSILRAGFGYVSIDPELPVERQSFIVSQVHASMLIEDEEHKHPLLQTEAPLKVMKFTELQRNDGSQDQELPMPSEDSPCYAIYTSGSTGRPKGCLVRHRNAAAFCNNYASSRGVPTTWTARMLSISNPGFDASISEYFVTMSVGGTICFATKDAILSDLVGHLQRYRVTTGFMTPSLCRTADLGMEGPHITHLALGGEPVAFDLVQRLSRGGIRVYNGYGPTETTVMVLTCRLTEQTCKRRVPIGSPLPGTYALVLDGRGRPCPVGAPGEIVIGGAQVTAGYIDLDSQAFYTEPGSGEQLYRTGDWGALRADGLIECYGRRDGQVKLRGLRIELGDIGKTILSVPGVADAAVMVREDALVAAYTRKASTSSDDGAGDSLLSSIKRRCEQRLPAYCVPSRFVCIANGRLPHTRNGKLDTAQLERIVSAAIVEQDKATMALSADSHQDADNATGRAGSALEEMIAEAWSHALNLSTDEVGFLRSFASLGGDSIKAVRVAAHLRRRGLKDVSVGAILACKTIEAYATRQLELEQAREQSQPAAPVPSQPAVSAKPARFSLLAKSRRSAPSVAAA